MKKYELTDETKNFYGTIVHRIRAIKNFGRIKTGELGGWIESEKNLSHSGECWIYGEAIVGENAQVCENARVCGQAVVRNNALVCGCAEISGIAWVDGYVKISGYASISDHAVIYDHAEVNGFTFVRGDTVIYGHASVYGGAKVYGDAHIGGNAQISGTAEVYGNARIEDEVFIESNNHYLCVSSIGSRNDTITFARSVNNTILVWTGCFHGTIDDFIKAVKETHGDNKYAKEYELAIELARLKVEVD